MDVKLDSGGVFCDAVLRVVCKRLAKDAISAAQAYVDFDAKRDLKEEQVAEYHMAVSARADIWVPAGGGNETPFLHGGEKWLYVYNPGRNAHGFLRMNEDVIYDHYEVARRVVIK